MKDTLDEAKKLARENLKSVIDLFTNNFDSKIAPLVENILVPAQPAKPAKGKGKAKTEATPATLAVTNTDAVKIFKNYTLVKAKNIDAIVTKQIDENEEGIKKFTELLDKLDKYIKSFIKRETDGKYYKEDDSNKLDWKTEKIRKYSYTITKLGADGSEVKDGGGKADFTIAKKLVFHPFVTSGIFYSDFIYPNYALRTEGDINYVATTKGTKLNVRPAVFLNLVVAPLEPLYPFIQVGISTGVNDVIFPVGAGFFIKNRFSISGGALLGQYKTLNEFKVGDAIKDEETLKNDLEYKPFVSWYFSINYNLTKK